MIIDHWKLKIFMIKIISFSPAVTKKIGATIAHKISTHPNISKGPVFILLEGNLGAGKTTFTLGFLKYFGIKPAAASPTFTIMKHYRSNKKLEVKSEKLNSLITNHKSQATISDIYHIDAYRLKSKKDLELIGFNTIKKQPHTVVIMEWPGNVKGMNLKNVIRVKFEHGTLASERVIIIH